MLLPKTKPILVGILYRPSGQSKFLNNLSTAISRNNNLDNQEVYILGDLNINLINKQKHTPNGNNRYKEFVKVLISVLMGSFVVKIYGLTNMVKNHISGRFHIFFPNLDEIYSLMV